MNTIDFIVLLVLVVAVWNGWRRGFIVQVCSLAAIAAGLWCAVHYGESAGALLRLDPSVRAAGGFVAVLVAAIVAIAVAARVLRRLFRFAGFGTLDIALGIAVSVVKYMMVTSALFAAFDKFNADYSLAGRRTVESSKCYRPVLRLSEAIFPFVEWVGDRVPQQKQQEE